MVCVEDGRPILRGIVSFGKGCGRPGLPGIYTRVNTYLDWIDESIEKMLARTRYIDFTFTYESYDMIMKSFKA